MDEPDIYFPPAAQAVLDSFRAYAGVVSEKSTADALAAINSDDKHGRMFESLQLVARGNAAAVVTWLLALRKQALNEGKDSSMPTLRKRVLMELMFLAAAHRVVEEAGTLPAAQCAQLESLCFNWFLHDNRYVPYVELAKPRVRVVHYCAATVGALSKFRLQDLAARFRQELPDRLKTDRPEIRAELLQLCSCMKHIRVRLSTEDGVRDATVVMEMLDPLKHTSPYKKSQLHHALCDMLTSMLRHAVQSDELRRVRGSIQTGTLKAWYTTIAQMRAAISTWVLKASKHYNDGYPFLTSLVCLENDQTALPLMDNLLDHLHRLIRDSKYRMLSLRCLIQLVQTYLMRNAGVQPAQAVHAFLERSTKPIMVQAKKGSFSGNPEQQDMLRQLCVSTAEKAPGFGIGVLICEFVGMDSYDNIIVGLRALLDLVQGSHKQLSQSVASTPDSGSGSVDSLLVARLSSSRFPLRSALDILRRGSHPFDVYGATSLLPKVSVAMNKVMLACHNALGSLTHVNVPNNRPINELIPKEKLGLVPVFTWVLKLVPYVVCDAWQEANFLRPEYLPQYASHKEHSIASLAREALKNVLRAMPHKRNQLIAQSLPEYMISRLPLTTPEGQTAVLKTMELQVALMMEWVNIVRDKAQATLTETDAAQQLELARVEAIGLAALCSTNLEIRRQGLETLTWARNLHHALVLSSPETPERNPMQEVTYAMDIIDNTGTDMVRRCYWDFGALSNLWQEWRPVPDAATFSRVMLLNETVEDSLRWARLLAELVKELSFLCKASVETACNELSIRLNAVLVRESGGRIALPDVEGARIDAVRNAAVFMCAAPLREKVHRDGAVSTKSLVRTLVSTLRAGTDVQLQTCIISLGHMHRDSMSVLLQELAPVMEEYSVDLRRSVKSRVRREDIRVNVAHVFRLNAANITPSQLFSVAYVRQQFLRWLEDTHAFIKPHTASTELFFELQQLCFCLYTAVKCLAPELGQASSQKLQETLIDTLLTWCQDGVVDRSEVLRRQQRALELASSKNTKDVDPARVMADLEQTMQGVESMAQLALVALLKGLSFNTLSDGRQLQVRTMQWIDSLFTASKTSNDGFPLGPTKVALGQSALLNVLDSNATAAPDLLNLCVEKCYGVGRSGNSPLAQNYFQVFVEVYAHHRVDLAPHKLLSLFFYKIVDSEADIRDDALRLFHVLYSRLWLPSSNSSSGMEASTSGADESIVDEQDDNCDRAAMVIGSLQDSYQHFQYQLSAKLAREHPELSELLCWEMLTRQLDDVAHGELVTQHRVLNCLAPWMQNLTFASMREGSASRLLKSMYYVTQKRGDQFSTEIERLWATVAASNRNIAPILDFLLVRGMEECLSGHSQPIMLFFSVAKRITLYLARASAHQTIDHLMYELSQQIQEDDGDAAAGHAINALTFNLVSAAAPEEPVFMHSHSSSALDSFSQRSASSQSLALDTAALNSVADPPDTSPRGTGTQPGIGSSRHSAVFAAESISDTPRGLLTRPQLSLCLLAEVAYEHDEDFRKHLPLLLHVTVVCMDNSEPLVYQHCQQVLINLLYSLAVRQLDLHQSSSMQQHLAKVNGLIIYLQSMKGRQLWQWEDMSLTRPYCKTELQLQYLVAMVLDSIFFEKDLKDRWAEVALSWSLHSSSRHLACRSHQVLRTLRPALSSDACAGLLRALQLCCSQPNQLALDCTVELLYTLQALCEGMPASKLVMYPQLFWACIALLQVPYVLLFVFALNMLVALLRRLDLGSMTVQNVLLSSVPTSAAVPPLPTDTPQSLPQWSVGRALLDSVSENVPLLAVQQCLIKGMFVEESETATVQALIMVMHQLAAMVQKSSQLSIGGTVRLVRNTCSNDGAAAVDENNSVVCNSLLTESSIGRQDSGGLLGSPRAQLVLSLFALLPWLCTRRRSLAHQQLVTSCIDSLQSVCHALGLHDIAHRLLALLPSRSDDTLRHLLANLAVPLCHAFLPAYAEVVLSVLTDQLTFGRKVYHESTLLITRSLFEVPNADLTDFMATPLGTAFVGLLTRRMQGDQGKHVMDVLTAVLQHVQSSKKVAAAAQVEQPNTAIAGRYVLWLPNNTQVVRTLKRVVSLVSQTTAAVRHDKQPFVPFVMSAALRHNSADVAADL